MYSSLPPDSRLLQFHRPDRQPRWWAEEPAGRRVLVAAALALGGLLVLALGRPNVAFLAGWLVGAVVLASLASGARTTRARAAAFALLSLAPALAAGTAVAAPHAADGPAAGPGGGPGVPAPAELVGTDRPAGVPRDWVRHAVPGLDFALWLPADWTVHDGSTDPRGLPDVELVGFDPVASGTAEADVFIHVLPAGSSAIGYIGSYVHNLSQDPDHSQFRSDLAELGPRQVVHVSYVSSTPERAGGSALRVERYLESDGQRVYQLFIRVAVGQADAYRTELQALPAGFERLGTGVGSATGGGSTPPPDGSGAPGPQSPAGSGSAATAAEVPTSSPPPLAAQRSESPNWAGYVADAGLGRGFQDVRAQWTQPAVRCDTDQPRSLAIWVGLDADPTVEQIGTLADCERRSGPIYRAWFQLYPEPMHPLETWELPVRPGDVLVGEVRWVDATDFVVTLRNATTGSQFQRSVTAPGAARATADWVVEAPSSCDRDSCVLPLADFGSAGFTAAAATLDGRAAPIDRGDWTLEAVDMVGDAGAVKATVGPLAGDGTSFAVRFVSSALR
ncbi:MAG: G1 family glutamic endopeptidase [Candidatus Limnocylindrales bacterium]